MLEILIDNIFIMFGKRVFQQIVDIPMGTMFLYSYEANFVQELPVCTTNCRFYRKNLGPAPHKTDPGHDWRSVTPERQYKFRNKFVFLITIVNGYHIHRYVWTGPYCIYCIYVIQ